MQQSAVRRALALPEILEVIFEQVLYSSNDGNHGVDWYYDEDGKRTQGSGELVGKL